MGPHEGVSRKIFLNANAGQGGEKNGGGLSKGVEPSTSYRETDSKFTSADSLRFAKARVYIPFPS